MNILITGANGFLGGKITKRIVEETGFDVIAVASAKDKVQAMCEREGVDREKVHFLSNADLLKPENKLDNVFGAVHLAFARRTCPAADIASSLTYASSVFHKLADSCVDHIINLSSQGVYGNTEEIRTEETVPAPENHYTMAKYASEVLFNDIMRNCPHHTNLRLDLVTQSQNVVKGLCKCAREGKLNLKGGKQVFSFIDVEDAAAAVVAMLKANTEWDNVYNVGWNCKRYTLVELADLVAAAAEKRGYKRPEIELIEADTVLWAGMDSSRFTEKTGWEPNIEIEKTILDMLV
ncbi:MAG: NAD-dependent epimerase/dehydratase family protein [Oscillospiraceae bacterium]